MPNLFRHPTGQVDKRQVAHRLANQAWRLLSMWGADPTFGGQHDGG
ncbi:MAG: hypothetical protein ACHQIM_10670 [Sphingobacteriales bacterium]